MAGRTHSRALAPLSLLALASLLSACTGPKRAVAYDLAARLAVAERWSPRTVILFGTPAAEPHQVDGFYREATTSEDPFSWSKDEAEISLSWAEPRDRTAVVELAPYQGVKEQHAKVTLNGAPVADFDLNDGRHRYRIPLPEAVQRAGENRLRFVFSATASPSEIQPGSADRRHLAAAFFDLTVSGTDDAGLDDLLQRGAPSPFGVTRKDGAPTLVEVGPSVVRYSLRLPEGAVLAFTPVLHPAARAAAAKVSFRVTLREPKGGERELWSRVLGPNGESGEVRLPLPGAPGEIVQIGLHVGGGAEGRFAWGGWRSPRLLARGPGERFPPPPLPADQEARGEALRRGLQGSNVLLIVLDAARAEEFGAYGYTRPTTPEIDRIAAQGVVFEDAFTPAVYTLAAMSSVWTSQYPDRNHSEASYAERLPADRLTLAEVLTTARIHSAGFVANAVAGAAMGFDRGFSEFHEVYRTFPDLGSRAEVFGRLIPGWLDRRGRQRFFAYLHVREPHFPYDPPAPFDTRFGPDAPLTVAERRDKTWYTDVNQGRVDPTQAEIEHLRRLYDGNLAYADREVGRIRDALERDGLWDRTVVIITADHGEQLYEHGYISHSAQVYDESMHIPLIVRFPKGKGPSGIRVKGFVDLLDLAPTVLDVFGLRGADSGRFHGRSLLPVIEGASGKPAILSRTVWDRPVYALRDEAYKLIYDTRTGRTLLFDLRSDPREDRDLSASDPLRTAYYREALQEWVQALRPRPGAPPAERATISRAQCENLKALGYLGKDTACPEE